MRKQFHYLALIRGLQLFALALAVAIGTSSINAAGYPDTNPDGSINTGNNNIFTVLTHGDLSLSGSSSITGDVGVGDSGNANLSGSAQVAGSLTINNKGKYTHSGSSGVTGTTTKNQTILDNAWADAISLSGAAQMEPVSPQYASLTNVNLNNGGQMTIMGGPNQKIVLSLQNFQLDHSSTFTLQGTTTTTFIINVAQNFSLDNGSLIKLVGVPPANVLFNVLGGGSDVKINKGSQASGIILALNRKVSIAGHSPSGTGSQLTGRIIAQKVELSDSARVVTPVTNP